MGTDIKTGTWKVLTGRVSLIAPAPFPSLPSVLECYRRIWAVDPDNFNKPQNVLMPASAQGKFGNLIVNCVVQPTRIDFNLMPVPPADSSLVAIEDTGQLHSEFMRIIRAVGEQAIAEPIGRVAIFLHLTSVELDHARANRNLLEHMPAQYRPKLSDEEDCVLQINRPQMSDLIDGVRMNFLTKWSVDRFQVYNVAMPIVGAQANVGQNPVQHSEFLGASITFDFNNAAGATPLTHMQQHSVLDEGLAAIKRLQHEYKLDIPGF